MTRQVSTSTGQLTWARQMLNPTLLRFAVVGAATTALDLALFATLVRATSFEIVPANLISYSSGILASFVLNRGWTFRRSAANRSVFGLFMRFLASNAAGLALSTLLVALFARLLPDAGAKILSVPIVFVWNYAIARRWVFS